MFTITISKAMSFPLFSHNLYSEWEVQATEENLFLFFHSIAPSLGFSKLEIDNSSNYENLKNCTYLSFTAAATKFNLSIRTKGEGLHTYASKPNWKDKHKAHF